MIKIFKLLFVFLLIISLVGCTLFSSDNHIEKEVVLQMKDMSLREKIAQMLIIYNDETTLTDEFKQELIENQVGGYIIFSNNITTYDGTKNFIQSINECSKIPMFIAVDEEGGRVQRLLSVSDKIATDIPSMEKIGIYNDLDLSYDIGTIIGEEVRSLGINTVFGPVLDVGDSKTSSMKDRLISDDPMIVANNGVKIAEGIFSRGVISVYKHFPGIGDTVTDGHYDLPVIKKTLKELKQNELIPFNQAIKNNQYEMEMIMVGHVNYPLITNDNLPSSLSTKIVKGLLREELGFEGVVITDAINMDALSNNYSEKQIFALGINATVDIFLMPSNSKKAIDIIEELINEKIVTEEQINASVKRILTLKKKYLENFESLDESYFGSKKHHQIVAF